MVMGPMSHDATPALSQSSGIRVEPASVNFRDSPPSVVGRPSAPPWVGLGSWWFAIKMPGHTVPFVCRRLTVVGGDTSMWFLFQSLGFAVLLTSGFVFGVPCLRGVVLPIFYLALRCRLVPGRLMVALGCSGLDSSFAPCWKYISLLASCQRAPCRPVHDGAAPLGAICVSSRHISVSAVGWGVYGSYTFSNPSGSQRGTLY